VRIAIGFDHAGFPLRERLLAELSGRHDIVDCGATTLLPDDDYPDYARAVGEAILGGRADRGIVVCGSGVGASVAASKMRGIRGALCHDTFSARQGVEDDDLNVLCIGARVIGTELMAEVVRAFLGAQFSGAPRHRRRLAKIAELERG
jgi:ribose 5-phosphate isomerase B